MDKHKYFLLYANNIPVKGASKSIICDLQLGKYYEIPNFFYEIVSYMNMNTINATLKKFKFLKKEILHKYINDLIQNDLGHYSNNLRNYPQLNTNFISPYQIQDSIIELSSITYQNIDFLLKSLSKLGCQTLELRSYDIFPINRIKTILAKIKKTTIRNVEIYLHQSIDTSPKNLQILLQQFQVIGFIVVHNCKKDNNKFIDINLAYTKEPIKSERCCGTINKNNFIINLPFFLESKEKNNCLNRKISIDQTGQIKNCPSLSKSYGNISNTKLENIVKLDAFKYLWELSKNKVNICKDCEFRYICSDCRAYLDNPSDEYSKPLKCGYNPYDGTWIDWKIDKNKSGIIALYQIT